MRLIVGLGNPGRRYAGTPHNAGFEVVEELAARHGLRWRQARRLDAEFADGRIAGTACALLKPTTYMNASGEAVTPLVRGEGVEIGRDLLVVVDDAALPLGRLRLRASGSSGGHRGLDSLIRDLGTRQFARLRCGVGPGDEADIEDMAAYVLAKWPKSLRPEVETMLIRATDAAEAWLSEDIAAVMTRYNSD